ncbi:NADPH-dependent fmn reductase [Plakobranchus ocellatus]|uniref:NADPH-dependent fmn reductase n=1 Tax=Plakobranchus ocellatus TaxID=259542 RepID=A0AAV3ZVP1_9GAST|nr:NADPH-dependent fmn reductase [Plakobranchus ocellatus]
MYQRYRVEMSAAANKLRVVLFLGSTREGRLGLRVSKFMRGQLEKRNYEVDVFDPVELKFPLLEKAIHHYSDRSAIPDWMLKCEAKVKAADAFLVVSAEYNHSIPPALSNMMDHFGGSLFAYKPSGIVVYSPGIYGGMRAAMQLRSFLSELGTLSVSNIFGIPEVHKALDEGGAPLNDHMEKGANTLLNQLDWMTLAMKNHRDKHGVPK